MAVTSPDNLFSPDGTSPYNWTVDAAAMQASVQAALNNRPVTYRTDLTNAQRLALTGGSLFEGLRVRTTDTKSDWLYANSTWVPDNTGAFRMIPTSAVNGTVGADGVVTFTGASSVSLNGVFTSTFREYDVAWNITTRTVTGGTGVEALRLRAAGVDRTTSAYSWRRFVSVGNTLNIVTSTTDTAFTSMAASGYVTSSKSLRLVSPAQAVNTRLYGGTGMETDNGGNFEQVVDYAGEHRVAAVSDGLTLYPGAGTITGTIRVIGYF